MADELIAWQTERARIDQRLQAIPSYVDGGVLATDMAKAVKLVEGDKKNFNAALATKVLGALELKIDSTSKAWFDKAKKQAADAVAAMKTYHGVALKIPTFENRLNSMDTDFAKSPPDFNAIEASRLFITSGQSDLKSVSDAYQTDYNAVKQMIKENCDDRLNTISDKVVAPELAIIKGKITAAKQKLEDHSAWLAARMSGSIKWEIIAAAKIVKEKDDYAPIKAAATTEFNKLSALMKNGNPGADAEFPLIKLDVELANQNEIDRDFYNATLIMKPMPARIKPLLDLCAGYTAYETALTAANDAIVALKKHHLAEYVQADIMAIEAYVVACMNVAATGKYDQPKTRLELVPQKCKDAETEAEKAAPFAGLLKEAASGDLDDLLKQAQARLKDLQGHKRAAQLDQALKDLAGFVTSAETDIKASKESEARAALTQAAELAALAYRLAEAIDQIYVRADALEDAAGTLSSTHDQSIYIKDQLDEIRKAAQDGRKAAVAGDDGALALLTDGEVNLDLARKLADAEDAFRIRHAEVTAAAAALASGDYPEKSTTGPKITGHLAKADEHSKAFDHIKASGSLRAAEALIATAKLAKTANAGGDLSEDDIRALIALPDGQRQLDAMVASLPDSVSQKVMSNLLAVRFNMDVKLFADEDTRTDDGTGTKTGSALDAAAPNLKAYYKMMSEVPDTHTKLNPSLARFDRVEDESGSYYQSLSGAVVMGCYAHFDWPGNALADPDQLDDVLDTCKPVPDSPAAPKPTYGKWTTLHEIGHAVDDRKRFMASRENQSSFGGWRDHGSDTSQIAADIATEFKYDVHFIERRMSGGSPDVPPAPDGVSPEEWQQRLVNFNVWLDSVREGKKLWNNASESSARQLKTTKRIIHEAYDNHWVSYDAAARREGVTGYQFRAPGEWFSELYAAYYTNKLNPSHPAQKWLAQL